MLNLQKILNPPSPLDNNVRRMRYLWSHYEYFGYFPERPKPETNQCRICHKIAPNPNNVDSFDFTCSPSCSRELEEFRDENHWN